MKPIKVSREKFLNDLDYCLTLIRRIESNLFECEYTSPSLHTKTVIITTF